MRILWVAVDEPIYLNPYLDRVLAGTKDRVVGVFRYIGSSRGKHIFRDWLLARLVFSTNDLLFMSFRVLRSLFTRCRKGSLSEIAERRGVPYEEVANLNSAQFIRKVREYETDILFIQVPQILKAETLKAPRIATLNRHMALIPNYQGAFPVFWQMYYAETTFGLTIHVVDEGIDTGPIVVQKRVPRRAEWRKPADAYRELFSQSPDLTLQALDRIRNQGASAWAVPTGGGSYFRKPMVRDLVRFYMRKQPPPTMRSLLPPPRPHG